MGDSGLGVRYAAQMQFGQAFEWASSESESYNFEQRVPLPPWPVTPPPPPPSPPSPPLPPQPREPKWDFGAEDFSYGEFREWRDTSPPPAPKAPPPMYKPGEKSRYITFPDRVVAAPAGEFASTAKGGGLMNISFGTSSRVEGNFAGGLEQLGLAQYTSTSSSDLTEAERAHFVNLIAPAVGVVLSPIHTSPHASEGTYNSIVPQLGPEVGKTKRMDYVTGTLTENVTVFESTSREGDLTAFA